ncbi:MAG TPA: right-handed parallel beta-helix repeat-containing protein [Actinomycetota bacterium]
MYIGADADLHPSRNIQVLNSTFDRNGRQGISVTGAEHVLIKNNTIADVRMCVIDLEPMSTDWYVKDVEIVRNTLGPRRITVLSAATQGDVDNVTLSDNTVIGTLRLVVEAKNAAERYSGFTLVVNVATAVVNSGGPSMGFTKVDDVYLSGNTIRFKAGSDSDLMALENSAHILIENNDLSGVDSIFNLRDSLSYDCVASNNKI